jgi:putative chitinase
MTAAQLSQLFPDAELDYLDQAAGELNTAPDKYGLDTPLRQAHFFAQIMQEAGLGLKSQVENLNYSPAALQATFRYYKLHADEADQDGYEKDPNTGKIVRAANQQQIANKAYANRNGNGDVASGDGWRYRGRGFIQVTGRGNYTTLTTEYQALYTAVEVDLGTNPELLENFPYTVRSAVCFWVQQGLPKLADQGGTDANVDAITAVVNKNTNSYGARRDNFRKAYPVFQ